MIALLRNDSVDVDAESVQEKFLAILPQIRRQALRAFRSLGTELRAELTQEVIAFAYCMFVRMARRDKVALAYPTPLAGYAIRQVRAGRRVGCRQNVQDIMWCGPRRAQSLRIQRLEAYHEQTGDLNQHLFEDRHAGPADTAAARLDLTAWFAKLSPRNRRIARALALGEQTAAVARRFGLTSGRISQLRGWLRRHWERFQGGLGADCCAT